MPQECSVGITGVIRLELRTKVEGKIVNCAHAVWVEPRLISARQAAFEDWCREVATLPAQKQVELVVAKLKELNPGFDGQVTHKVNDGTVTELRCVTDNMTDMSPVRALTGLRVLDCSGSAGGKGSLASLWPLASMKLTLLSCHNTRVSDLTPLVGMKLPHLVCYNTNVSTLVPLKGMPLTKLACDATPVSDLSPLKGMPLAHLHCGWTQVADLSPLAGMPLTQLLCQHTQVSNLSPLQDMKLTCLYCPGTRVTDLSALKGMPLVVLW
jgi:hypothetical protein